MARSRRRAAPPELLLASLGALCLAACGAADARALDLDEETDAGAPIHRDGGSSIADGGGTIDAGGLDAGPVDAGPPPSGLEIGTGETEFKALAGQSRSVQVVEGPQGGGAFYGFHIWLGARIDGRYDPASAQMAFSIRRAVDDEELSTAAYTIDLIDQGDGNWAIWGMRGLINDCCKAENQELILRVALTDAHGKTAVDERHVSVANQCVSIMYSTDYCP